MPKQSACETLALFGGPKSVVRPFTRYNRIGPEEAEAAQRVIDTGVLSKFIGAWHPDFNGGPAVKEFEQAWLEHFRIKHAVTVNSCTSGLIAAVGAIGTQPGDEIIVSPWTMCASATAILHWNAIPVFADIESDTFCLDPASVERNITPYTRAIIAVDIFGHSANLDALSALARKHGLKLISDTAQAPGAFYKGRLAGTLADIGVFSLNYHKHIHTGEGGVAVTNDDDLAERLRLIRNHAEAVTGDKGVTDLTNMLGYNFRLGEIECAIGLEQLKKLNRIVEDRQRIGSALAAGLTGLRGLRTPVVQEDCTHVYYMYPLIIDADATGIGRTQILKALRGEGLECLAGGYQNLHLLPIFQQKIAYGSSGFPWNSSICRRDVSYERGICPVAETLQDSSYLGIVLCLYEFCPSEVESTIAAFQKVWANLDSLRQHG
jgi:dTDP-4-amino-4,6-dideoxygalactose transaminase